MSLTPFPLCVYCGCGYDADIWLMILDFDDIHVERCRCMHAYWVDDIHEPFCIEMERGLTNRWKYDGGSI